MITNENEFLGLLIKNMNDKHECNHMECMKKSELDEMSYLYYMKSIKSKGYISSDLEKAYITQIGINSYVPIKETIKKSIFNFSKFTLKTLFEIIIGIAITVFAAFLVYFFGWQ